MLKRVISSIVGLPILIVLVVMGGLWLQVGLGIVIIIGLYEFYGSFGKRNIMQWFGMAYALLFMIFLGQGYSWPGFYVELHLMIAAFPLLVMILLVLRHKAVKAPECMIVIFGFFYVAVLMSTIFLTTQITDRQYLVWLAFLSAWGCDTGAYAFGKTLGKRKLVRELSPNKTVAGAIGGGLTAAVLCGIYGGIMAYLGFAGDNAIIICVIIGGLGGIAAQFGDLSASAIKRYTGKKDFGSIIPGHGGVLDRFDSILFTAPLVYAFAVLL